MKIAFIGIGKMGLAMVSRLLEANFDVTVFSRNNEKQLSAKQLGANTSVSIADAVKNADYVMSCVLDDKAVLSICDEMAKHMKTEAAHISLATIMPETAKKAQELHQQHKTHYVSAVVLGIPKVASAGQLTSFYACDPQLCEPVEKLLSTFANTLMYMNTNICAPNVMKVCMNYSLATSLELISELYLFAEKSGLDTAYVQQALHKVFGHPAFKLYVDKIHDRDFDNVNFDAIGGNKDINLFCESFNHVGVEPQIGKIVKQRFDDVFAKGMENKDWSTIYEIAREKAGLD